MNVLRTASAGLGGVLALAAYAAQGAPQIEQVMTTTAHQSLYAVAYNGEKALAVGDMGTVYESANGGGEWSLTAELGDRLALHAVATAGSRELIVGQQGAIFIREKGTKEWQEVESGTEERLTMVGLNSSGQAIAGGTFGTLLRSNDAGDTWQSVEISWDDKTPRGMEPHLWAVDVSEDGVIHAVGEFGLLLRSEDGGESWVSQSFGQESLFALHIRDNGTGFAVGQQGVVIRTLDAGQSWEKIDADTEANLLGVWVEADGRVVVPAMRAMLYSPDNGDSWRALSGADVTRRWYVAATGSGDGSGIISVGEGGRIVLIKPE